MTDYGDEVWALDPIDLMSVEEFEAHLVGKFGPEYLEPIPYAWQGGSSYHAMRLHLNRNRGRRQGLLRFGQAS